MKIKLQLLKLKRIYEKFMPMVWKYIYWDELFFLKPGGNVVKNVLRMIEKQRKLLNTKVTLFGEKINSFPESYCT